jgi:hypothetical protein
MRDGVGGHLRHVGQDQVFEGELFDGQRRVVDRGGAAHDQGGLPVGMAVLDHLGAGGQVGGLAAGTGEPVVAGQQLLDLAGDADPGGDEHDQVVADALQVGDQVRGQDHAAAVLGDEDHQALQELPPRQGVEAGHGFVEDEQVRSLRDGQGQRQLGALAAIPSPPSCGPALASAPRKPRQRTGSSSTQRWIGLLADSGHGRTLSRRATRRCGLSHRIS